MDSRSGERRRARCDAPAVARLLVARAASIARSNVDRALGPPISRAAARARVVLAPPSLTPRRHHIFPIPSPQAKTNNKKATKATPRKASSAWTEAETAALTAGVKKHGTGAFDPPPIFPRRPADRRDSTRRRIANGQFKPTRRAPDPASAPTRAARRAVRPSPAHPARYLTPSSVLPPVFPRTRRRLGDHPRRRGVQVCAEGAQQQGPER